MRRVELSELLQVVDALEGTGVGAWGLDVGTSELTWSPNIGPLFGREVGFAPKELEKWFELVHPLDLNRVVARVGAALEEGADYETDFRVVWPDDSLHWLTTRGHVILDVAGERPVRVVGVISDSTERQRANDRDRLLATAEASLGGSLDMTEMLEGLAQLIVRGISDWCAVQLLEDGLLTPRRIVAHRDTEMLRSLERLWERYPTSPEPEGLAARVVESGEGVLVDEIDEDLLRASARNEEHYRLLKSLGLRSALVVPLKARGEVLGLMSLGNAGSQFRLSSGDLTFAEELGRRAGTALENSRLHRRAIESANEARRVSRRLTVMQEVISSLSQAVDVASVANVAITEGAAALGASRGAVVLRRADGPLEIVASVGYPPERLAEFTSMVDLPGPLRAALENRMPVHIESLDQLVETYPNLADAMSGVDSGAFAAVPLFTTEGTIGAMGFVYDRDRSLTEDQAFTSALAQHVGLAIERSMQFDASRRLIEVLHSAIAPNPMDDEIVPAAARFRSASYGAIGGDWHDMVTAPDARRLFIVGDVVGRGIEAVGAMAALRHSLRMLLQVGYSPERAFSELNRLARVERSAMGTTAICIEARSDSSVLRVTSAGHLPPIVLSDGRASPVWVENGPPLGIGGPAHTSEVVLRPDEYLIVYSDGAIERPEESIDESLKELCDLLSGQTGNEQEIAEAVYRDAPDTGDDLTVLVISGRRPSRRR